jgi:hypothetical protein
MRGILVLILGMMLFSAASFAQKSSTYDKAMSYTDTWFTYTMPTGTNATTTTDSTWTYTVWKESDQGVKYDFKLKLDSIGGTKQRTPVVLKAKKNLSDSWTTVTTVIWLNGNDTTVLFTQTSTAQYYRYWQIGLVTARKNFIYRVTELTEKYWK